MAAVLETIQQPDEPPIVFVSYSHRDEQWKDMLLPQLSQLGRLGILQVWDDRQIKAGVDWYARIKEILAKTRCAVCLITANFLNSSFCMDEEIPYLLQQRYKGNLEIFPILLEDCVWDEHPWLKRWQILPRDAKPVRTYFANDPAQVFAEVARQVRDYLTTGKGHERPPPPGRAPRVDITRLPETGALLFGRRTELNFLTKAWDDQQLNVVVFKASGGVGKSTLIRCWAEALAEDNYRGAERVFGWSFYSQGTKEQVTSADEFIAEALQWFGDDSAGKNLSPWDRGKRLAELIQRQRTLLLLDGLEPLQSGHAFDRGKLKDPGLEVLLFELGKRNPGLCVITTREPVADLADEEVRAAVRQFDLDQISNIAGRALLRVSGIEGMDEELEAAVGRFANHAYAIKLLGSYLTYWHDRHISHSGTIPDLDIPIEEGGSPRRVMQAFAERFGDGPKANLLALLGLFDRPAEAGAIAALKAPPAISGLTEHVVELSPAAWEDEVADLRRLGLFAPASHHAPDDLDAHPLVRSHFGSDLRGKHPQAWRAGHERLYEYFKALPEKRQPDTLEEMAPLFQAVFHGCQAEKYREVYDDVYWPRILRGNQYYVVRALGAFGTDIAAISSFFDGSWERPVSQLYEEPRGWLVAAASSWLTALGRLREAVQPARTSLDMAVARQDWVNAARGAGNLSGLQLELGDVAQAIALGREGVGYADRTDGKWGVRVSERAHLAKALHEAGERARAEALFQEAEQLQAEWQPDYPSLYSTWGYYYCDLLLDLGRHAAVRERATRTLEWAEAQAIPLDIALDHLSLGRAELAAYESDRSGDPAAAEKLLNQAVDGLRQAGHIGHISHGLLARAAYLRTIHQYSAARQDLDAAKHIATRSGRRLFECTVRLELARLALAQGAKDAAREHVAEARRLVDETGYGRRFPEIAELEGEVR